MARRKLAFGIFIAATALVAFSARRALAASLYLQPAAKSVDVGAVFNVAVVASSPDQAMNAVSGDVSFPTDALRVLSVSSGGSAIDLWVQKPTFSNGPSGGNVIFSGIILNPGYTGPGTNILTMQFQALTAGGATISFDHGSILANDGKGTNILQFLGISTVDIAARSTDLAAETTGGMAPSSMPPVLTASSSSPPVPTSAVSAVPGAVSSSAPQPQPAVSASGNSGEESAEHWLAILLIVFGLEIGLGFFLVYEFRKLHRRRDEPPPAEYPQHPQP